MNPSSKSPKSSIPRSITDIAPVNCCTWSGGWVMKAQTRKPLGYLQLNSDMQPNLSWISIRPIQASQAPYHDFDQFCSPQSLMATPKPNAYDLRVRSLKGEYCYAPQPPVNPRHWTTDHPQSDMDLAVNHRPYPSVADRHTWASVPIPTFFVAITHSLIKHQPLFPRIVITHADSFLPNPAVANFVCTLDLLLLHAHLPQCLVL